LLTIDDAAARLGVSVRMIRRLVFERRIPYVKVGKYVRFEPGALDEWLVG
jgi:excisionase family DNA binding protein